MDTIYVNQIHLIERGIEKNKEFLVSLYNNEELKEVSRWFDKLDYSISISRKLDRDMTLDEFIKGIDSESSFTFQLASPDPFYIKYCASYRDDSKNVNRFAGVICSYNDNNFDVISGLYKESFGCKLKDEPIQEGLLEYYKGRMRFGY